MISKYLTQFIISNTKLIQKVLFANSNSLIIGLQGSGSLDPHDSAPKRHLDQFGRFSTAHPCDQHTDILPSVTTHLSFTESVVASVTVSKVGVILCRASSVKSMDSIDGVS